ncbi:WD40 repeat domain-containing protein, partial [Candidatus Poribacteria bacterium]|nr:WD40 repeat domain-containing protein [Candidatus Poribacteria bacterium]
MSTFKGTVKKMNPLFKGKILIGLMMGLSVTVATVTVMSQSRLYRHTEKTLGKGQVQAIQFSPDGEWLAIGTSAILELYSTQTYQLVHVIETNVEAIDFSPDSKEITIADQQMLRRLDIVTGGEIATWEGHEYQISDVAYSSDGALMASIDVRGVSRLWRKGEEIATFRQISSRKSDFSLLFSPDAKQLIIGASDVEIWEVADEQLVSKWRTNSRVTSLALHPDGTQLAVGTAGGEIELWSLQTGERTEVIDGKNVAPEFPRMTVKVGWLDTLDVVSLSFSPDGKSLVMGFDDAVITIWDTINQTLFRSWLTKTRPAQEFKGWGSLTAFSRNYEWRGWSAMHALSPDGRTIVSLADRAANVGRWDVETGRLIGRFEGYNRYPRLIGFSTDSRRLATLEGVVRVWDTVTSEILAEIQYDNGSYAAALSPDGKYVAINHKDRRITVWDVDMAAVKHVLPGQLWNRAVTFSPDSRLVAAVTFSFMIRVWEVETGEQIAEMGQIGDGLGGHSAIRFSPDGNWLATGAYQKTAIWETQAFTLQHVMEGLTSTFAPLVTSLEFSPDSRWIASYADEPEYKIKFWNIETGKIEREFPTGIVFMATFSPDGRWLATGVRGPDYDHYEPSMKFWEVGTGKLVLTLSDPFGLQAIFSPDGNSVALSHNDGRIHLIPIETVLPQAVSVDPKGLQLSAWGQVKENALLQNYPNPFNPETWLPYDL